MNPGSSSSQRRCGRMIVLFLLVVFLSACGSGKAVISTQRSSCFALPFHPASSAHAPASLTTLPLPGHPLGSAITTDGQWIFVSVVNDSQAASSGLAVLHQEGEQVCLLRVIPLDGVPLGVALTHDNRFLLMADDSGIAVVDVARAKAGTPDPVLGQVQEGENASIKGAFAVSISLDDRYAFIANENDGTVGVINLQRFYQQDLGSDTLLGQIQINTGPLNEDSGPAGMAISPDDRYLCVTSRIDTGDASSQGATCNNFPDGTLSAVAIAKAVQTPVQAQPIHTFAGCGPVRVVLSSSGDVAWVAAQGSNMVLAFSTSRLLTHSSHSLLAAVPVDKGPTGIVLIDHDAVLVVTNSNRSNNTDANSPASDSQAPSTITMLDTKNVLAGRPALLGTVPVGSFPRELTLRPDGQLVVLTNYNSNTLTLIDVKTLPGPAHV